MRNLIIGVVTATALLAAPAAAGAATADPPWTPVTNPLGSMLPGNNPPLTVPADQSCTFQIDIAVVTNNEFQQVTTQADGTIVVRIKGNLVASFKNDATGKTVVENVSGPSTQSFTPSNSAGTSGSGTFQGEGPSWFAFGPNSKKNTGEPGLVFTKGNVSTTFTVDNNVGTTQTFSLNGTQQNGCDLLS